MAEFLTYITDPSRNLKGWELLKQKIVVNFEQNPRIPIILAILIGILLGVFGKSLTHFVSKWFRR